MGRTKSFKQSMVEFAGEVKRHIGCKCHGSLTLVSNKLDQCYFSTLFQWNKNLSASKCNFEETVPKLSVNSGNCNSQDSHKN